MKVGDFVKPTCKELKFILDRTWYLIEKINDYNKNSQMIKLKGQPLYFNSKDFERVKQREE